MKIFMPIALVSSCLVIVFAAPITSTSVAPPSTAAASTNLTNNSTTVVPEDILFTEVSREVKEPIAPLPAKKTEETDKETGRKTFTSTSIDSKTTGLTGKGQDTKTKRELTSESKTLAGNATTPETKDKM